MSDELNNVRTQLQDSELFRPACLRRSTRCAPRCTSNCERAGSIRLLESASRRGLSQAARSGVCSRARRRPRCSRALPTTSNEAG